MLLKPFLRSFSSRIESAHGNTIVEFLVASTLSLLLALMIVGSTLANRAVYQHDIGRTKVNQDLRSALNLIGTEVRQAGEQFPASFPAILIANGGAGPDTITLRRNLLSQVLVGCDTKVAGVNYSQSNLAKTTPVTAACTYPNQQNNYTGWYNYAHPLGAVQPIYIFDQTTRNGEFLSLATSIGGTTANNIFITFAPVTIQHAYTAEYTSIYMISEWKFSLSGGILQLTENGDTSNIQNVIDNITDFKVSALMQDGTTKTDLINTDNWTTIAEIQVSISGSEYIGGKKSVARTVSSSFFPRNILSN